ncbi:MAG: hypothetical protein ACOYM8_13880, partial [Caulobacterales bacterium]
LKSAVSAAQIVVVRPPKSEGVLTCGGVVMLGMSEAGSADAPQIDGGASGVQVGKRYMDEDTGLEVLGAKAGPGELAFAGRALTLKDAKKLPTSD